MPQGRNQSRNRGQGFGPQHACPQGVSWHGWPGTKMLSVGSGMKPIGALQRLRNKNRRGTEQVSNRTGHIGCTRFTVGKIVKTEGYRIILSLISESGQEVRTVEQGRSVAYREVSNRRRFGGRKAPNAEVDRGGVNRLGWPRALRMLVQG